MIAAHKNYAEVQLKLGEYGKGDRCAGEGG